MASQVNNIGTLAIVIFLLTLLFGGLYYVGLEVSTKNTKLDTKSNQTLTSLGVFYNDNITKVDFKTDSGEFNDSNFDGVDAFVRQYLEDKSEIEQKKSLLNTILLYPSFLISIFGVEDMIILTTFSALVYGLIVFLIALMVIKAIRGEVD